MEGKCSKKLERWCYGEYVATLNTTTGAALLSSEALNVLTLPAHSTTVATHSTTESVSDNDSECGGEEDDNVSDNDLEMVGEQSGTADSTDTASGGTESPVKKATLTED